MKLRHVVIAIPALVIAAFWGGMLCQIYRVPLMTHNIYIFGVPLMAIPTYLKLKEPLLLDAGAEPDEGRRYFYMLPAGTALYEDWFAPEGFICYKVYININGAFAADEIEPERAMEIAPSWGNIADTTTRASYLKRLISLMPVSKEDLIKILKARKMTKAEVTQLAKEWPD